jgi:hypothetical protein
LKTFRGKIVIGVARLFTALKIITDDDLHRFKGSVAYWELMREFGLL